jgi:hypothetical protein
MSRLVLVGESNPYGSDPSFALYHLPRRASGDRLRAHLGLRDSTYDALDKENLCDGRWSVVAARGRAGDLVHLYDVVVCLGAKVSQAVADATGWERVPFFGTATTGGARALAVVSLPHPSGLCRVWHEPGAREKARAILRQLAPDVPWGEADAAS